MDCGLWCLAEFENGEFRLNRNPQTFTPIQNYLGKQGRFKHLLPEDLERITQHRDRYWERVRRQWAQEPVPPADIRAETL